MQSGLRDEHRRRTPAGGVWFCLKAGAITLAGTLVAAVPAHAVKAAPGGNAPNSASPSNRPSSSPSATPAQQPASTQRFDIDDFAVQGADKLPEIDLEEGLRRWMTALGREPASI